MAMRICLGTGSWDSAALVLEGAVNPKERYSASVSSGLSSRSFHVRIARFESLLVLDGCKPIRMGASL